MASPTAQTSSRAAPNTDDRLKLPDGLAASPHEPPSKWAMLFWPTAHTSPLALPHRSAHAGNTEPTPRCSVNVEPFQCISEPPVEPIHTSSLAAPHTEVSSPTLGTSSDTHRCPS